MKRKLTYLKTLVYTLSLAPSSALALTIDDASIIDSTPSIKSIIINIITYILGFAAAIAVLLLIYGGIVYMTSSGDEKKTTSAKGILTGAVIGLVIVIFASVIINLTTGFATTAVCGEGKTLITDARGNEVCN